MADDSLNLTPEEKELIRKAALNAIEVKIDAATFEHLLSANFLVVTAVFDLITANYQRSIGDEEGHHKRMQKAREESSKALNLLRGELKKFAGKLVSNHG